MDQVFVLYDNLEIGAPKPAVEISADCTQSDMMTKTKGGPKKKSADVVLKELLQYVQRFKESRIKAAAEAEAEAEAQAEAEALNEKEGVEDEGGVKDTNEEVGEAGLFKDGVDSEATGSKEKPKDKGKPLSYYFQRRQDGLDEEGVQEYKLLMTDIEVTSLSSPWCSEPH